MEVLIEGAMQTPDGLWRVEIVRHRGQNTRWYRIVRGDDDAVLDWLPISAVERILDEAGDRPQHPDPGRRRHEQRRLG
jgi:hypothetical protein